jgi:ABC-type branched-subunit amino acid transport system permease subunit
VNYYITTLLVYAGIDIIACIALNMQFGVAGLVNFGFILFQAAGAYTAAVLSLPPQSANGGFQFYILGLQLPFPIPWIAGGLVGGLLAIPIGLVVLRKLRGDFQAIALLVVSVVANLVITNARPLFNGAAGLALVPAPLSDRVDATTIEYQYVYVVITLLCVGLVLVAANQIAYSPYGRSLRAMRDNEVAAAGLGKNLVALKLTMFVIGGIMGGLSGAILVGFIGFWGPAGWLYPETIVLFAAIIVGGRGNNWGAIVGAILVPIVFFEATRFIPALGPPGLVPALQWVVIALCIMGFLWFRPRGLLPERRRRFAKSPAR